VDTGGYWGRTVITPMRYVESYMPGEGRYYTYSQTGLYCNATIGGWMGPVNVTGGNVGGMYHAQWFSGYKVSGQPLRSGGRWIYDVQGGGFTPTLYATNGGIGRTVLYGGNSDATYSATGRIGPITQKAIVSSAHLYWYRDAHTGQRLWSSTSGAVYGGTMNLQYQSLNGSNQWYGSVYGKGADVTIGGTSTMAPPSVDQIASSRPYSYITDYTGDPTAKPQPQYGTTGGSVTGSLTQEP